MKFVQKIIDKIRGEKKKKYFSFSTPIEKVDKSKIYLPYYNLYTGISDSEPDIHNKDGRKMDIFFLRCKHTAHNPYFNGSKYFLWDRFNHGLKTHFYSHDAMLETMGNPTNKYGMLIESKTITQEGYCLFETHKGIEKDFDAIFTYDESLLNTLPNAKFVPFCSSVWYGTKKSGGILSDKAYENKTKNISILSSDKQMCELHKLRIEIAQKCKRGNFADTYGTFDGGALIKVSKTLSDYRYSIAIENDILDYFFTEKITNCFASMTVPIYLGARKIDEFFNADGIIKIKPEDVNNLDKILAQCNEFDYEQRLDAIKDNFNRVQKFININDYMYENYFLKKGMK